MSLRLWAFTFVLPLAAACIGVADHDTTEPFDTGAPADSARADTTRPTAADTGAEVDSRRPLGGFDSGGAPDAAEEPDPPSDLSEAERDLLRAVNDERERLGLTPVAIDPGLQCAARRHVLDVGTSGTCGHVGADGSWPWDRAEACGFPQDDWTVNEIAAGPGFSDGADAVWGWSHSSGHYAALTHPRARFVGVGVHMACFIALFDCCVAGSE